MVSMVSMAAHPGSLPSSGPYTVVNTLWAVVVSESAALNPKTLAFFSNEVAGDTCLNDKAGDSQRTESAKFEGATSRCNNSLDFLD